MFSHKIVLSSLSTYSDFDDIVVVDLVHQPLCIDVEIATCDEFVFLSENLQHRFGRSEGIVLRGQDDQSVDEIGRGTIFGVQRNQRELCL